MTDTEILIDEYGIPPPAADGYGSGDAYRAAYDAWFEGFANWVYRREEEAARLAAAEERAGEGEEEEEEEEEEEAVRERQPEPEDVYSSSGSLSPEPGPAYPSGIFVDPAGNLWSESGDLLSPGTTPAMEPAREAALEATGEPVADTALLLLDLLDALTGEDGVSDGVEGVRQALDRPLMTTSFRDYTVTEGLLLLLLLSAFVAACAKILKGGFSWL